MPLEPFVPAVPFGANLSFVTQDAFRTKIPVMNAGGCRLRIFVKVGTPLTAVIWASVPAVLSAFCGL